MTVRNDKPSASPSTRPAGTTGGSTPAEGEAPVDDTYTTDLESLAGDPSTSAVFTGDGLEAKGRPAGDPEPVLARVREQAGEMHWSDGEVDALLGEMDTLDAQGFRTVMDGLDSTELSAMQKHLEPTERRRLVEMMATKGYVEVPEPDPDPELTQRAWGNPPASPRLAENARALPAPVRKMIHEENVVRAQRYEDAQHAYLESYISEVVQADGASPASIRKAGPPLIGGHPREPGVHPVKDKALVESWATDIRRPKDDLRLGEAIHSAVYRARGEVAPGDSYLTLEGALKHPGPWVLEVSDSITLGSDGFVDTTASAKAGRSFATGGDDSVSVSTSIDSKGEQKYQVAIEERGIGLAIEAGADHEIESIAVKGSYELIKDKVDIGVDAALKKDGTVEVGASLDAGVVEGRVAMGSNFHVSRAALERSINNKVGFFETPPELADGVRWDDVHGQKRALYEKALGWSGEEWDEALKRQPGKMPTFVR